MKEKCAVFSCLGLGDGLIALVLAHNLWLNGYAVTTFHPFLSEMQGWFPHLPILPFSDVRLAEYERFFLVYEKSSWMEEVLRACEEKYPGKLTVLNPIATSRCDYPYWEGGEFDGRKPFVDNLLAFCQKKLGLKEVTRSNGVTIPKKLRPRFFSRRVALHPTSSKEKNNWPREKYLFLAQKLKEKGYEPVFILTGQEKREWEEAGVPAPIVVLPLGELAAYLYESGYFIGNDSGVGHLASCLGVPTLTICRRWEFTHFWRPSWAPSQLVAPPWFIPNSKGLRLRDTHWKKWISVGRVLRFFTRFTSRLERRE